MLVDYVTIKIEGDHLMRKIKIPETFKLPGTEVILEAG